MLHFIYIFFSTNISTEYFKHAAHAQTQETKETTTEQHTHTRVLRTDTTHTRPPDQRIPYWYYTKPTRKTDGAITTAENHQSTITSKKRSKNKDKETLLHRFTRTGKAKNHVQDGKAKFPENSRERKRTINIPHHIVSPQNLHPEAATRERQVLTTWGKPTRTTTASTITIYTQF